MFNTAQELFNIEIPATKHCKKNKIVQFTYYLS